MTTAMHTAPPGDDPENGRRQREKFMGRTGSLLGNQTAHKRVSVSPRALNQFPLQCPGEHIGGGAPPSAKEEIDTALRSTRVASIRRTIFFMRNLLHGIATRSETNIFFLGEEIRSVRKARDEKCSLRRYTDRISWEPGRSECVGVDRVFPSSPARCTRQRRVDRLEIEVRVWPPVFRR